MFTKLVSEVLNRALGTYIEDLDSSKLKVSIWGGDVELCDLVLRQSAFDDLNLPVRPVLGHVGHLLLKIPWSNPFKEQWVATVENVSVVVVPNTSIQYNAEQEEKLLHDSKMATLQRGEEAKLKLHQQQQQQEGSTKSAAQDGYVEKLIAQAIRNIQVTIKSIHIRYEDSVSCHGSPFAAGFTLYDLSVKSTDASWTPCLDTARLIYKLNSLECLGIYWNPNAELFSQSDRSKEEQIKSLTELIASKEHQPRDMNYIIGPICSTAKLKINTKPEEDEPRSFSIPKINLDFVMDTLALGVSRRQYSNVMALLDAFDRLNVSSKFRKYRPSVSEIKGNSHLWWKYAYECKLEDIRRVRQNWSWTHMKAHRDTCRRYKNLYKLKLENKKLSSAQLQDLNECERALDVFNITLMRRQSEMEVEREGELRKQKSQSNGWFSGWFFSSSQETQGGTAKEGNLIRKFEEEMSDEEKKKLYEAIGYSESGPPPDHPKEYVNLRLEFLLKELVVTIKDENANNAKITEIKLEHVASVVQTRSSADALRVEASVQSFFIDGFAVDDLIPRMVTSEKSMNDAPLLDVMFETSPLDGSCDQRVRVKSEPLRIVYDANTVAQLGDVFSPPENVSLQQLQAAALNQLEVVKERSVAGLQSAIDNHSVLDLDVVFAASHIIVPETGSFSAGCSAIILTLGSVLIKSVPRVKESSCVTDLLSQGHSQEEVMDIVRSSSYDHFTMELVNIQALVSFRNEDWKSTLDNPEPTSLHLLQPTSLHVDLLKCLLMGDPSLPKVKINVCLPNVTLSIVDQRLLQVAYIAHTIPGKQKTPEDKPPEPDQISSSFQQDDVKQNIIAEDVALARLENAELNPDGEQRETPQFTNLVLSFIINEVDLEIKKASGDTSQPLMKIAILSASVELTQRTFDLTASIILGGLLVKYLEDGEKCILSTPLAEGSSQALLTINFKEVDPKSPEFENKHSSTARLIGVDISNIKVLLEQSAILSMIAFTEQLNQKLSELSSSEHEVAEDKSPTDSQSDMKSTTESWEKMQATTTSVVPHHHKKQQQLVVVRLKLVARLGQVSLTIGLQSHKVAQIDVAGLVVNVLMKDKDVTITSQLKYFSVSDPNPSVLHPKIVEVVGSEAWDAQVSVYEEATEGAQYLDMQCVDTSITLTFGCARIVFLNKFITDVLNWVDRFQSAKAAVANAGVAAAGAAQARLQEAYVKCSRVSLSLTLRAPLILIPQDSGSLSGLVVDLGLITINNKFELGEERNELGYPAIYDKIDVQLLHVKITRVALSCEGSLEHEYELVRPISLNVSICRNLTISWHRQRPELEIQAHLKPIKMCLNEADMQVMMSVLKSNFAEQPTVPPVEDDTPIMPSAEEAFVPTAHTEAMDRKDREQALAEVGYVFTKVKFSFTIQGVILSLLKGGSNHHQPSAAGVEAKEELSTDDEPPSLPTDSDGEAGGGGSSPIFTINREAAVAQVPAVSEGVSQTTTPLADVNLDVVTLKGEMKSDGSLVANLVLFDCILRDTRLDQEGFITKMMARKTSTGKNGMLDLTYRTEASKDTFVDVRISGFVLVMHLPYLLMIQRFFTDNMAQPESDDAAPPPSTKSPKPVNKPKTEVKPRNEQHVHKPKTEVKARDVGQTNGVMTIRVKMEPPDIALVEDVSSVDTSCIILHAEVNSDVKVSESSKHIAASITNLQMYTCCYNPKKRQKTLSQILDRCEVTFVLSMTPSHAEHIDIKLSQVHFRVSPGTIELLSSIGTALSSADKPMEGTEDKIQDWTGLWDVRPLDDAEFPFLSVEEAQEAIQAQQAQSESPSSEGPGGELAFVALQCFLVTLESGSATSRIPLMKLQTSLSATAAGFHSQKLMVSGELNMEVAYYNPRLAVWEPLLEPVEVADNFGPPEHLPWTVHFELTQDLSPDDAPAVLPVGGNVGSPDTEEAPEADEVIFRDAVTTVSVTAKDPLELTVTKTFMEVLTSLSEAFAGAYRRKLTTAKAPHAPYRIINQTGMHISVAVIDSGFQVLAEGGENVEKVTVESGAEVDLFEVKPPTPRHRRVTSLVADCQTIQDRNILVQIPSVGCMCSIPVACADKRFFQVDHKKGGDKWGLVASISVDSGCKVITFSSCVKVVNHLDVTVDVYYMTERGNEVEFVLSLKKNEGGLLPLHAVYTPTAELFFSVEGHSVCCIPFVWRLLQNDPDFMQELVCVPRDVQEVHATPFLIAATGEMEQILWENTKRRTINSTLYTIHLRPCIILHNLLPIPISVEPPGSLTSQIITPGSSLHLTKARLGSMYLELQLQDYQSRDWVCGKSLDTNPPELSVWSFESRGEAVDGPLHLELGMLVSRSSASVSLSLYCPYWMVNKTGLMLTYKGDAPNDTLVHEADNNVAILFSFKSKAFFGKKKAAVKVEDSDWSSKFSLDVVGSSGSVLCRTSGRNYQVGVDIQLGKSGLTKIVVFSPFYKILNTAPYDLEVIEVGAPQAEWFTILSGECIGWWPVGGGQQVRVRARGTKESTASFSYDHPLSTLLALPNRYGGVASEVSMTEAGVVIKLGQCFEGAATVLLVNHLPDTSICLWQQECENDKLVLEPLTVLYYTWAQPGGTLKMLWTCNNSSDPTDHALNRDDKGTMDNGKIHWAVFLNNNQRCLLFTDKSGVAEDAVYSETLERLQSDITLSLNSIALSIVDDDKRKEIAYISLVSSGVVWEYYKGRKHRPFTQAQTELLEKHYLKYQSLLKLSSDDTSTVQSHFVINDNLEVDYATLRVEKPFKRNICRKFQPGIWFQLKVSPHQRLLHLKVNSIQIDNQMSDVMFPVVLARVPPPRSVMADIVPSPFCEVSVIQRLTSPVFVQYKYLAVLIQEFHVKVELPFIFSILEVVFPSSEISTTLYSVQKYEQDISVVNETLASKVSSQATGGQKDFFDRLHLSPIKMHLSFSLSGLDSGGSVPVGGQVIHLFLQSVGVTLTEVQDIVFRLACMERTNQWMNWGQLVQEMVVHYRGQVIKQLYVLVLGLDVIGNPIGLVVGFTKGVGDLFYEPIQGAIEGPGEFAEGMVLGVSSFVGKSVGGAAGAMSRITGTIGKGVAALTLDDEYQKRRREAMHRKPADGVESLARGGKGIVTGVVDGVTGVFLKPIDGAREEGVEGFIKGVGKGVVGLVARPASGVIDFASGSFDTVMRATDSIEEVGRRRPARFIATDCVVRPYVARCAQGAKILQELKKGRYAKTDVYIAHAYVTGTKSMLIATNKRVMHVTRNDLLGNLKVDWMHCYNELSEPPTLTPKGFRLSVKQEKKRLLGVFGGGDNSKFVQLNCPDEAQWFISNVMEAYQKSGQ